MIRKRVKSQHGYVLQWRVGEYPANPFVVVISGPRKWASQESIYRTLTTCLANPEAIPNPGKLVFRLTYDPLRDRPRGVARAAYRYAMDHEIPMDLFPAARLWDGPAASARRDMRIFDTKPRPSLLLVFWHETENAQSTRSLLRHAEYTGTRVFYIGDGLFD